MVDYNYESYCGLYCGSCSILKAYQTGERDAFANFFEEEAGLELKCHGCKTDVVFKNCAACPIRGCARNRGIEWCPGCPDFPCSNYQAMGILLDKLPHWGTAAVNQQPLPPADAGAWVRGQAALWQCPQCQADFTWYASQCFKCGVDLQGARPFSGSFDKSIFQMINAPSPEEMFVKQSVYQLAGMDKVRLEKDIAYSADLLADLYFPAETLPGQKLSVVILVHGDTPIPNMKDSGQYTSLGRIVAASGMVGAAFNHRSLMQGFTIKDVLADIESFIGFLADKSEVYGIAPDQMSLWSFSSGVPFALYAGMQNALKNIKCQAAFYGFGDLMTLCGLLDSQSGSHALSQQAEAYSIAELLQQEQAVSPLLIARAGMDGIPYLLPSLDGFIEAALLKNAEVDLYNHASGMHAFDLLNDHPRTHEIMERTLEFIKRRLG